ncbi:Uncharacterized protease YegQ [hydrothermal vent metagenome]|uniref:Uncharacterized protease YegQ n=1 Tax=hydrothermal vent metagenome TaxID=652676 RepID=A0A3B0YMC8_9ZZZZ
MMKIPELLAPAGTMRNLRYAIAYGADAVYAGMPRYSLRVRNNDFNKVENLAAGIEHVHVHGKQFFMATNVLPHNSKVKTFLADMEPVIEMGPDALIMADPGLIMLVRERWPDIEIHLSVQANTMNYASVKFWQQLGIKRIILSRELSLDQVEEIRQECPDIELEVFVHGALCIAYSGRCLLSGYFNHRDANQGSCTNACRWDYKVKDTKVGLIEEANRPGELMPIEEDEHGTYIMNSKDLRAVEHVERLVNMGIDSLKIEGRTKSHYYTARTAQVYRKAIDDAVAGQSFDPTLLGKLENLANRGYTDGFFQRHHEQDYQNYIDNHSKSSQQRFVGELVGYDSATGYAEVDVKNHFEVGDELELIMPTGNRTFKLEDMRDMQGQPTGVAPGSGHRVKIPMAVEDCDMALLAVNLTTQ